MKHTIIFTITFFLTHNAFSESNFIFGGNFQASDISYRTDISTGGFLPAYTPYSNLPANMCLTNLRETLSYFSSSTKQSLFRGVGEQNTTSPDGQIIVTARGYQTGANNSVIRLRTADVSIQSLSGSDPSRSTATVSIELSSGSCDLTHLEEALIAAIRLQQTAPPYTTLPRYQLSQHQATATESPDIQPIRASGELILGSSQ